jgi:hypothetical protein
LVEDKKKQVMDNKENLIELLFERVVEYVKLTLNIFNLKALDKASDVVSSFIMNFVLFSIFSIFFIFLNLGLAFWLGDIWGQTSFGFFLVAAFYAFLTIVFILFMRKWVKRLICNYIIKTVLK